MGKEKHSRTKVDNIQSETRIIWELIKGILLLPIWLVLSLFGKKSVDVLTPFKKFFSALIQPKFTTAMIFLNVTVFIVMVIVGPDYFIKFANYPSDLFSSRAYTLVTSGFIHASVAHLLGNMLFIFIFGRIVERELGSGKTAIIYFVSMIFASALSSLVSILIFNDNIPGVGASGAIMGLVSTAILLSPFSFVYELILPLPVIVIGWLAILADITGVLSGVSDGIGHFAHIGGFITIFLLMPFLKKSVREKLKQGIWINLATLIVVAAIYLFIIK